MHLTLEADYAVRIVDKLAIKNKKMGAQSIAEQTNVPLRFALKILRKLVACGAVKSYKGAHGGYIIAKDPKEITLREIIEAVEGPFMISRCQQDDYCCCNQASCRVHNIYAEISLMVRDKLESYNFSNFTKYGQLPCTDEEQLEASNTYK